MGSMPRASRRIDDGYMKTRTGKAFLNMSTSLADQIIAIVCGLITPRLILATFGSTYNGVISSATQFLNMINILTLGITAATRVALYKPLASNDILAVSSIVKATKRYMRKVAVGVIIYAVVLCVVYPFISQSDLTPIQCAALIAIVSIGTFANYFFGISDMTLLQAAQSTYITNITNIIKTVTNTLCVALLIALDCSIYTVKLGSSIVFFIAPAILSIYVKKRYSITSKCSPNDCGIKGRKATAFHAIANVVHDNVSLVTLTFFADAKVISVYTVYYFVAGKIKSLVNVFTSGMEAAFGDMWAKGEYGTLNRNFRTYEYMLFSFTTVVFSCVGVLILPFVAVYTMGVTDVNYIIPSFAVLMTIAEGMYCIRQPYLTLVYSTGSFEETKWGAAIEAIVNIVVSVVMVNFLGICGVVIGTLVANTFRTVQFAFYVSKKILKRSILNIFYRVIWVILTSGVIVILSLLVANNISFEVSWLGWILEAVIVFVIAVITALTMSVAFYRNDLISLLKIGLRIIKR